MHDLTEESSLAPTITVFVFILAVSKGETSTADGCRDLPSGWVQVAAIC